MTEQWPELHAILRAPDARRYRLSQLICQEKGHPIAEVFKSPAGPILVGEGLLGTEEGYRHREGSIVRYLSGEPADAAVSLQCRCSERTRPVWWVLKQRGRVKLPRGDRRPPTKT